MDVVAGMLLEARRDTPVAGIVHWGAPLSTGFESSAATGTRLRVIEPALPGATAVGCDPVDPALETRLVAKADREADKYAGFHVVIPLAELGDVWRVLDPIGPERTLLEAVRVLHRRGAHGIQVMPYHYATGHWRCPLLVGGREVLGYSNGGGWVLPGRETDTVIDPEEEADAIWAVLDEQTRATAELPNRAYVFWFGAMLDRCQGGMLPSLWDDYSNYLRDGYVRLSGHLELSTRRAVDFPLPPGDALSAMTPNLA